MRIEHLQRKWTSWNREVFVHFGDGSVANATRRYVALARVSSREQEREGFSLDVQVDALRQYTYASKSQDLRDREAELKLEIDVADKGRHEIIDIAVKAFELSQSLREKWFDADYAAKRRILEIIGFNWTLDDVSLVPEWRKPFDLLAKGLVSKVSRDDWI